MKLLQKIAISTVVLFLLGSGLFGQSLLDNEEFRRARELRQQAEEAFDAGEYDQAVTLSEEAEEFAELAREQAEQTRAGFRAANARTVAQNRLNQAESLNVRNEMPELWEDAQAAFEAGQTEYDDEEYVDARESFLSVRDILDDEVIAQLRRIGGLRFEAAEARANARTRLNRAEELNIGEEFPDEYDEALGVFDDADDDYDAERWQNARDGFRSVLDIIDSAMLSELNERAAARAAAARAEEEEAEEPEEEEDAKPEFYIVRRIPERRDSFWRIAEYEFIYDNPWEWPRIYEANRDMLQEPDNPDLIQPGMRFRIPSLEDESRAGTWNPEDAR